MSRYVDLFRHIDLKEIVGRLDPGTSSDNYRASMPGMSDKTLMLTCWILKELWTDGGRPLRMEDIIGYPELNPVDRSFASLLPVDRSFASILPAVLKRLNRIRQIKLDVDREGAVITPGKAWIET